MKILLLALPLGALALAGCDVNVTSNDADTRNTLNAIEEGASDLRNDAAAAGKDIVNGLDTARDKIDNVSVDVDLEGNSNKAE
jgi:hypothetical protein